jgi:hypothetical protein
LGVGGAGHRGLPFRISLKPISSFRWWDYSAIRPFSLWLLPHRKRTLKSRGFPWNFRSCFCARPTVRTRERSHSYACLNVCPGSKADIGVSVAIVRFALICSF